jgi:hypothetical protein
MKDENMCQLGIPTTSNFKHQPLAQAFCLWPSFGVHCKQQTTSSMRKNASSNGSIVMVMAQWEEINLVP